MARSGPGLGESLAARLMARSGGVHRRGMPDGGEVFTGALVDHVMARVLGGNVRGFAMEGSVFMPSSFDPSRPADQATYAHEVFHTQQHHGGSEGGGFQGASPDHEEAHARSLEQMVLHRAEAGEALSSIMADLEHASTPTVQRSAAPRGTRGEAPQGDERDAAIAGYHEMRREMSHKQVIDTLARYVLQSLEKQSEARAYRNAGEP